MSGLIILFQTVFIIYDNAVWMTCSGFSLRVLNERKLTFSFTGEAAVGKSSVVLRFVSAHQIQSNVLVENPHSSGIERISSQ